MILKQINKQGGLFLLSYCTNYLATMPEITVYINCDTRLAINLRMFNLGENDEFIFAIKNYNYIDSPYAFLFRARQRDIDENGEVIFKITPAASKHLKPGAFYNFAVLANAFDVHKETEYKKLTDNGSIKLEYGAQDLIVKTELTDPDYDIVKMRLERLDDNANASSGILCSTIIGMHLEPIE